MISRKKIYSIVAILLVAALSLTMVSNLPPAAYAGQSSSAELKEELEELERQKAENDAKLAELEGQIANNRDSVEAIMQEKAAIEQQIQIIYDQLAVINAQIATYSQLIADKKVELDEANARYNELNEAFRDRIRTMEEQGDLSYWAVLFKATNFSDFLDRLNMINEIAGADKRRLQELKTAAEAVKQAQAELEADKAALEQSRADLQAMQATLEDKNAQADLLLQELLAMAGDLNELYDQFEKQEAEFLDQIANKENEYNTQVQIEQSISASKKASSKLSSQKESSKQASIQASINQATAPTGGANSNVGSDNPSGVVWLVPCTYTRVTSPFGYRWHPTTGEWSMHKGVDLGAAKGTPIYATRSGTVTVATYHTTAGNYVTINHGDGYRSTYMHMTNYVVKVGQYVKAGQLIGYVGSTGRSTGPHLHFGILYGDGYVNPMDYIG